MTTKDNILKLLINNSDYLSGEEMAKIIGVSRNAIWKNINSLIEDGIKIDSKANKGYKLAQSIHFLDKVVIDNYLGDDFYKTIVFDSLSSTSTYLKNHVSEYDEGTVVFAREQINGRGRLDRSFYSPKDTGIYFSILVKPHISINKTVYLTVLSAVSVNEAILEELGIDLGIKWINDLYKDDKKVCGILAEGAINIDYNYLDYCVIGIGINILKPKDGFLDLEDKATFITSNDCDLNKIASAILKKFKKHYLELLEGNLSFVNTYIEKQILIGKQVEVLNLYNDTKYNADVIGVSSDCMLEVKKENGKIELLNSGEVRIIINK